MITNQATINYCNRQRLEINYFTLTRNRQRLEINYSILTHMTFPNFHLNTLVNMSVFPCLNAYNHVWFPCLNTYNHVQSCIYSESYLICLILFFVGAVGYFECHSSYGACSWACLSFIYCCLCRLVWFSSRVAQIIFNTFLLTYWFYNFLVFHLWMITSVAWSIN